MRELFIDGNGSLRFVENPLVRQLLDAATERGYSLNELLNDVWSSSTPEQRGEFAQLIGYSASGYCELSYVDEVSKDSVWEALSSGVAAKEKR